MRRRLPNSRVYSILTLCKCACTLVAELWRCRLLTLGKMSYEYFIMAFRYFWGPQRFSPFQCRHGGLFHYSWRWFEYLVECQWKKMRSVRTKSKRHQLEKNGRFFSWHFWNGFALAGLCIGWIIFASSFLSTSQPNWQLTIDFCVDYLMIGARQLQGRHKDSPLLLLSLPLNISLRYIGLKYRCLRLQFKSWADPSFSLSSFSFLLQQRCQLSTLWVRLVFYFSWWSSKNF